MSMDRNRRTRHAREGERGVTLILVAIAMVSMLAMVALAIDVITLYSAHSEAQSAADAAALAAAKMLVDSGVTGDPGNGALQTAAQTAAIKVAQDVAGKVAIAGRLVQPADVTVAFGGTDFAINPTVNVTVQNTNLPTFFSRIWSRTALTVRVSAKAEAFNPSNSSSVGTGVPVVPRCVKPFIIPNCDPNPGHNAPGSNCAPSATIISAATGAMTNPGQVPAGIIGESFTLRAACTNLAGPSCTLPASSTAGQYYPAQIAVPPNAACPSCTGGASDFQTNIECCNPTPLACGVTPTLALETGVFPDKGPGPALDGVRCLIHQNPGGQDLLNDGLNLGPTNTPLTYPVKIQVGTGHPLQGTPTLSADDYVTTSDSVVTLPIYDGLPVTPASTVTIIGFLQVFINQANPNGSFDVTVLNVSGCGSSATGTAVYGAGVSAVPVRLIQ